MNGAPLADLLQAYVACGDEDAMEEFVARTRPRLLAAVRHIERADAEDAVQATYLALLRRGNAEPPANVYAWLCTAAIRLAYRRKAKRRREAEVARRLGAPPEPRSIDTELVRLAVDKLPTKFRDPIVLHHLNGLSTAETAQLLDIEPATVRTRLHRGRALLKSRFDPRLAYGVATLPWLAQDLGSALMGGWIMSRKVAAVTVVVLLLAGWGVMRLADTDSAPERSRAPSSKPDEALRIVVDRGDATSEAEAPPPEAEQEAKPFLTGIVVDSSEAPLEGVAVRTGFMKHSWIEPHDATAAARTGADGRFALSRDPGKAKLTFVKAGYAPVAVAAVPDMRVVLRPAESVACVVTDLDGRPIEKAGVSLMVRGGPHQRAFTDAEGRVRFATVPADAGVRVGATSLGYMLESVGGGYVAANTLPETVTLQLKRLGLIVDVVDAASGAPLADARVVFAVSKPERRVFRPVSPDLMGNGWFHRVPGQHYVPLYGDGKFDEHAVEVHATAPGYATAAEVVRWQVTDQPPHHVVRLTRGASAPSLTGTVTGGTGAEVEVLIAKMARHPKLARVGRMTPGPDGRFAVAGLPAGRYRVLVRAPERAPLSVEVELPTAPLRLRLTEPATLVVETEAPGAWLHVQTPDGCFVRNVQADANGRAEFAGMPAGPIDVFPLRNPGVVTLKLRAAQAPLVPGRTTKIAVRVPVAGPCKLHVRGAPGATVYAMPQRGYAINHTDQQFAKGKTDTEGNVTLTLFGDSRYLVTVKLGSAQQQFEIDPVPGERIELHFDKGATLRGRIVDDETGDPVSGYHVAASIADRVVSSRAATDGTFDLGGLPKRFTLKLSRSGASFYPPGEREVVVSGAPLEIRVPRVDRGAGARLRAVVRDSGDRKAVHHARVHVAGLVKGTWFDLGRFTTNARGLCEARVFAAETFRVTIYGNMVSYRRQVVETGDIGAIEVALVRQ